jgi:hypothetical protein
VSRGRAVETDYGLTNEDLESRFKSFHFHIVHTDRLCGLVVRVPGYRSSGPGSNYGATDLSLEQCPLSFGTTIEELLGRNNSGSGLEKREYGSRDPVR